MDTPISLSDTDRDRLLALASNANSIYTGRGSNLTQLQTLLTRHDRFGSVAFPINAEKVGLTFFTKPRLNMTTVSLRQDPQLAMMDSMNPMDWMFGIRCNLDTVFARSTPAHQAAVNSPWFNDTSAFNIPLSNALIGQSGWPDFNLEYETTEAGYFSEDMTLARGSDRGRRTYDINCTFRDVQGGWVMSYIYYWLHAMALQMEGAIVAYPSDREANRLNYTCSIYRFVLDTSLRTITKWAKATGCFPVTIPIGEVFNFNPGDSYIHTSQSFSVTFKANHVAYMDPRHLAAFNTLVERYAGSDIKTSSNYVNVPPTPEGNFIGIPYVELFKGTNELMWKAKKSDLVNPLDQINQQFSSFSTNSDGLLASKYTDSTIGDA